MAERGVERVKDVMLVGDVRIDDCTCYYSCGNDSHSGNWHQHEDDPCPVHPDAPMVG